MELKTNYFIGDIPLNALLFADDQIFLADSEENFSAKTKILGFKGVEHLRAEIEINNQILEQVTCFNYLGCKISYVRSKHPEIKLAS
jgi:hypothetical protein